MELQQKGAKNLNLVTATQWLPWVTQALDAARRNGLTLPVAYNTGGYETVETVKALAGYVDIWLADYKYASPALAKELSAAQDYPQVAHAAIRQMLLQTGAPVYDADGYPRFTAPRSTVWGGALPPTNTAKWLTAPLPLA